MNFPPNAPPPGGSGGPPPGGYAGPPPGGYGVPHAGYSPPIGGMGGPLAGPMPQAPFGIDPVTGLPYSDKSRVVAGLLQIFLGSFGVGRFYLGHTGLAVAQLLVSWVTCGIWPLIDGIWILMGKTTDAEGRPLRP